MELSRHVLVVLLLRSSDADTLAVTVSLAEALRAAFVQCAHWLAQVAVHTLVVQIKGVAVIVGQNLHTEHRTDTRTTTKQEKMEE
jgi:hypothetical protein